MSNAAWAGGVINFAVIPTTACEVALVSLIEVDMLYDAQNFDIHLSGKFLCSHKSRMDSVRWDPY